MPHLAGIIVTHIGVGPAAGVACRRSSIATPRSWDIGHRTDSLQRLDRRISTHGHYYRPADEHLVQVVTGHWDNAVVAA